MAERRKSRKSRPYPVFSHRKFAAIWERLKRSGELDVPGMASFLEIKSHSTLYAWRRGDSEPTGSLLFGLAYFLDVHHSELME